VEPFWRSHLEAASSFKKVPFMSRVVKCSVAGAIKTGGPRGGQGAPSPLPSWIPPQLCQPVEKAPSGPQWLHEIKLDGFRMAARIDHGRAQLLTRTGLDWTDKYPNIIAALANVKAKTAYLDGELCGVDDAGLPSFAQMQAATDGERGVRLVYYAFDLLHLDGRDVSGLPLIERKALLEPLVADTLGVQFNGHETGDGELILKHAGKLGFEGVVSNDRCALRAGKSRAVAQSEMVEPAGIRRRRVVRPGRNAASPGSAAVGLLHR
jgi:bifunctional non-homologous end joining protein LigD